MGCVLRGGATTASCEEAGGTGFGTIETGVLGGGMIAVVDGRNARRRNNHARLLLRRNHLSYGFATAAPAIAAGTMVEGRGGMAARARVFSWQAAGITAVLLAGDGGVTGT